MAGGPGARILVIKLGALGDFVQALGPFAAIRRHHGAAEGAHITLLTTGPYADFAAATGYFDAVWTDGRPGALDVGKWLDLRRCLRRGGFRRVYDLQTSGRSSFYLRLFWPGPYPEWSGVARGCSHPHANPRRDFLHTLERQAEQLRMAGIAHVPVPDLSRIGADTARFGLPGRYALLVAGGARHRPAKRWPADRYGALARWFAGQGIEPVVLGTAAEGGVMDAVRAACARVRTLAGETDLADIVQLARGAVCAVGNDTGPMHLIAAAGCPCVVLYSDESDPALCAQRGPDVTIVRRERLADLSEEEVAGTVKVLRPSLTGR